MTRHYYVYIMTSKHNTVLYTGVTNDLKRRVYEHKQGQGGTFTSKYKVNKLVYYEIAEHPRTAITREKQLKGGSRKKKSDLIDAFNPQWKDLYEDI